MLITKQKVRVLHFWGTAGKRIGFQFFFSDVNEEGKGFDTTRQGVPGTGMIRKDTSLHLPAKTFQNLEVVLIMPIKMVALLLDKIIYCMVMVKTAE
jgi:hypothetical protein